MHGRAFVGLTIPLLLSLLLLPRQIELSVERVPLPSLLFPNRLDQA